jgi:hypothetical protein
MDHDTDDPCLEIGRLLQIFYAPVSPEGYFLHGLKSFFLISHIGECGFIQICLAGTDDIKKSFIIPFYGFADNMLQG